MIQYKSKIYPIRVLMVKEIPHEIVVAPEQLFLDMISNLPIQQWDTDCEESIIDSEVTFFVDDECMSFSAGKLCMDCFITPLTLIEEIKLNYELQ